MRYTSARLCRAAPPTPASTRHRLRVAAHPSITHGMVTLGVSGKWRGFSFTGATPHMTGTMINDSRYLHTSSLTASIASLTPSPSLYLTITTPTITIATTTNNNNTSLAFAEPQALGPKSDLRHEATSLQGVATCIPPLCIQTYLESNPEYHKPLPRNMHWNF